MTAATSIEGCALRRRYGRAGLRPIRLAPGEKLGVAGVLAGAYRGKDIAKRNTLEHVVVLSHWMTPDEHISRTLCRRIPVDSLADLIDFDLSTATCPECRRRIAAVVMP